MHKIGALDERTPVFWGHLNKDAAQMDLKLCTEESILYLVEKGP